MSGAAHAALELGHAALGLGARGVWMLDGAGGAAQELGPRGWMGGTPAQELEAQENVVGTTDHRPMCVPRGIRLSWPGFCAKGRSRCCTTLSSSRKP